MVFIVEQASPILIMQVPMPQHPKPTPMQRHLPYWGWPPEERLAFEDGLRVMSRSVVTIFTWALVTGLAMGKSALTIWQALGMSLLVFAGTAQLAALPLIALGLPVWTILLTAFVVNLRFVIFSIGMQAHFRVLPLWRRAILGYFTADFGYLMYTSRYPDPHPPEETPAARRYRIAFMYGLTSGNWSIWQLGSISGIILAGHIPQSWGLEFAGTLALIAIIVPMLDRAAARWAAGVAAIVAVLSMSLPLKLNIVLAIIAAIAVGIVSDRRPKNPEIRSFGPVDRG
jgi:predicted branched-subunit amino acid permease